MSCQYGVLQELAAVGTVDQHFISNPEHSVFRKSFKQHHNFAVDWDCRDNLEGHGSHFQATVTAKGDICIGMALVVDQKAIEPAARKTNIVIQSDISWELRIGGQHVQSGYLSAHDQYGPVNRRGHLHAAEHDVERKDDRMMFFLNGIFCSKEGTPMPLRTSQHITIHFTNLDTLGLESHYLTLRTFQVYLDALERDQFAQAMRIPIMQQHQTQEHANIVKGKNSIPLHSFSLPVHALKIERDDEAGLSYELKINGQTRFSLDSAEMRSIAEYIHPNTSLSKTDVYYFGIPSDHGFGGAFNMSKVDHVELIVDNDQTTTEKIVLTVNNYNVLTYQDGRYTLMYTD